MRPSGFYWVRFGNGEPEVAEFESLDGMDHYRGRGLWHQTGSEDFYIGDEHVEVLAGPLTPPGTLPSDCRLPELIWRDGRCLALREKIPGVHILDCICSDRPEQ